MICSISLSKRIHRYNHRGLLPLQLTNFRIHFYPHAHLGRFDHLIHCPGKVILFVHRLDSGLSGQRYELLLWPTPDSEYDLTFRYNINPDALASDNDYALGGPALAETILQSCRAAADRIFNDNVGAEYQMFVERLKTSVSLDRRMLAPERLGYAHDPNVVRERFFPWPESYALPGVTVNGVTVQ